MNDKKWYKKWWAITFFCFLGLIFLIVSLTAYYSLKKAEDLQAQKNDSDIVNKKLVNQLKQQKRYSRPAGVDATNYKLGTTSPRVTIVEFADFSCPHSQKAYSKIRKLGIKYSDYVKIIFRDYPGDKRSLNLSMAANCAGTQGLFWPMHDKLFSNQGNIDPQNNSQLTALAKQVGADTEQFQKCLNQQQPLPEIKKDIQDGKKMEIKGTPTYFINGYKISGDIPYEILKLITKELLKK